MAADVYMFPGSLRNASLQIDELVANLTANSVKFGRIWFDVETDPSSGCQWSADKATNCAFMTQLAAAAVTTGVPFGVYSSTHMWTTLMSDAADGCPAAASLPLWYPHYQTPHQPNFADFAPFGGWTTPTIKQYWDSEVNMNCGVGTDMNWMP